MIKNSFLLTLILAINLFTVAQTPDSTTVIQTMNSFLQANHRAKEKIAKKIIQLNPDFYSIYNRLKKGKKYSEEVTKGFFEHLYINKAGIEHPNLVFIPFKYNPTKKTQVRLFLHGGISSLDMRQVCNSVNRSDTSWNSVNTICLFPASWIFSPWWSYNQYENLAELLNFIKDYYNVDENDIYITGVSDGGTGIYYLSNFFQTPFSCFLPFIGNMYMLTSYKDKQMYIKNYQGLSFLIVNGRKDEIFDIRFAIPSVNELKRTAKEVKFFVVDSSKHNTRWYPVLKDSIKNFINTHKRNPFPDKLYYATEKPDTFGRKYWIKIDRIGKTKEGRIEDSNQITINNQTKQLFHRFVLFGQIEVQKTENRVYVKTQNVKKYTLLISPDFFDLNKPIEVYTNDILSFKGNISKDIKTLIKYNIEDNDRTMLFSDELKITVGKTFQQ